MKRLRTRADQLMMLTRLEWLVLGARPLPVIAERWFAWLSADAPELSLLVSASRHTRSTPRVSHA